MKALMLGLSLAALAVSAHAAGLQVQGAELRAVAAGAPSTAGYMTVVNPGAEDQLLSATCACAAKVEAHLSHVMNGMAMMMPAGPVEVPAGGQIAFRPGSYHLMFTGLKGALKDGGSQPVTLKFAHAGAMTVDFQVHARIAATPAP